MKEHRRVYAEINLDAVLSNVEQIHKNLAPDTKIMAVVKTDGYGHGSVPIAKLLQEKEFLYGFGVATVEEAVKLRKQGIHLPILILGYAFPECFDTLAQEEIRPALFREDNLLPLAQAAAKAGKKVKVHIKVDTGMSRVGIRPDESGLDFIKKTAQTQGLEIEGIFTHFARADETNKTSAYRQLRLFREFIEKVEQELEISIPVKHCSNSAGVIELPEANLDLVRPGIIIYGLRPSNEVSEEKVKLTPALSLYSHIIFIKELPAGSEISYGGTYVAEKPLRVATVPVGYGDGYPRSLSGKGYVLIHGKRAPILGRICMDQFMVDVTEIPEAKEDDLVTLVGCDGKERLTAERIGEISGRFHYEFVCDLGKRVPRVYVSETSV